MILVQIILYKFSVWDSGATYGAKLQNLRYKIHTAPSSATLARKCVSLAACVICYLSH